MKVYIVINTYFDDTNIEGVFADKDSAYQETELANDRVKGNKDYNFYEVHEWEVFT